MGKGGGDGDALPQTLGRFRQQLVTQGMAAGIVEMLEMVQVQLSTAP